MKKNLTPLQAVRHVTGLAQKEGVSLEELLARARVDRSTFWRWKNKKKNPNPRTIIAIESVCTFNK